MKKFQFKLDGLLKVRKFKEQKIKIELGEIVKEMNRVNENITSLKTDIVKAYDAQEALLEGVVDSKMLEFYPYYIKGKSDHITHNESLLFSLDRQYREKVQEMQKSMGDVKVVEDLKEKEKIKHKKLVDKKQQESVEELLAAKRVREKGIF